MTELFTALFDFMDRGGPVMWPMIIVAVLLWWLILERLWFYSQQYPSALSSAMEKWKARPERLSWYADLQQRMYISELESALGSKLPIIVTLIALLPMFGLLGTVTGMLQVFEVMAFMGSGNPRAMATGVSAATIPTMAGMVIALAALPFSSRLDLRYRRAKRELTELFAKE